MIDAWHSQWGTAAVGRETTARSRRDRGDRASASPCPGHRTLRALSPRLRGVTPSITALSVQAAFSICCKARRSGNSRGRRYARRDVLPTVHLRPIGQRQTALWHRREIDGPRPCIRMTARSGGLTPNRARKLERADWPPVGKIAVRRFRRGKTCQRRPAARFPTVHPRGPRLFPGLRKVPSSPQAPRRRKAEAGRVR
jgi:hypothetical protein